MAKKTVTITTVVDDFDDKVIDDGLADTIDFSFEGTDYTIDLRPTNADKFRKDMEKWLAAGTRVTGKRGRPRSTGSTRAPSGSGRSKEALQAARDWLNANGHEVAPRGRIKGELLDAYDAAHQSSVS